MKKILYLEGAGGISGDMTVAALLDLGADRSKLDAVLRSLELEGFTYSVGRKHSYGLAGCDFDVNLHHHHHHEQEHEHGFHSHEHRNLADVYAVIDRGAMSENARTLARRIFRIVADAEAKAHGCPVEEVHFHEVGAIDSIADIVATAVCVDDLGITDCVVTGLSEGSGTVHCRHGELPVPVPAVLNIAQRFGIALRTTSVQGEMVTPTGIAIAAALRTRTDLPAEYTVANVGIGLGKRDFGRANCLRAMILEEKSDPERIYILESNIDDSTGELFGLAMEELFRAGAMDVHFIPCYMKKNRPAYLLRVIAAEPDLSGIEEAVFRTTTTIGLRKYPVDSTGMKRTALTLALACGEVNAKQCTFGGLVRCYPEYESVRQLAVRTGLPFQDLFDEAKEKAQAICGAATKELS